MRVSVFGVGYVGCVSAACLAREGHEVMGVDVDPFKVSAINGGQAPFREPGLNELVAEMVLAGRLHATTDHSAAVHNSDVALICVGTPPTSNGSIRLDYLTHVFAGIGKELRNKSDYFVVALRSTVLPKIIEKDLIPLLEQYSGKTVGRDVGFVYNPEFLREGTALRDFYDPPWTIIGSWDTRASDTVAALYQRLPAPTVRTDPNTAVLVKYFSNAFHAMKVAFANEVSYFCREARVDSRTMMKVFCQDSKLNVSSRYLKPGFAFGGSCLPKDLKALMSEAGKQGLDVPLLDSILVSNDIHLRNCIQMVAETGRHRLGLVGLTFKEGTDDLRGSPAVEMAERLMGKGFDVRIYEPSIAPGRLHGSNLSYLERSIPHIWKVLSNSLNELIDHAEVIVIMQQVGPEDRGKFSAMTQEQICIDLAGALSAGEVGSEYRTMDGAQPTTEPALSVS
jgi:GDP-mannose 6-dehydrogenase